MGKQIPPTNTQTHIYTYVSLCKKSINTGNHIFGNITQIFGEEKKAWTTNGGKDLTACFSLLPTQFMKPSAELKSKNPLA